MTRPDLHIVRAPLDYPVRHYAREPRWTKWFCVVAMVILLVVSSWLIVSLPVSR